MTRERHKLDLVCERAAHHPQLEAAVMGAVRQVLPSVIKDVLREIYPGEQIGIKLSIPKTNPVAKAACVARILQLKDEGKSHSEISKIVKVSKSTVFNVVARRRSSLVG